MEKELKTYYETIKKPIAETTIKLHVESWKKITGMLGDNPSITSIKSYLSGFPVRSALIYLRGAIAVLSSRDRDVDELNKFYLSLSQESRKCVKPVKLATDYAGLVRTYEYYANSGNLMASAVTLAYLELPIRNDLPNIKHSGYNVELDNYFDGKHIVLNSYKTSKVYGPQKYVLSTQLASLLKRIAGIARNAEYLFVDACGEKFEKTAFLIYLRKLYRAVLGFDVSFTQIRKIKINELYKHDLTLDEIADISDEFMHSIDTELTYYKKKIS